MKNTILLIVVVAFVGCGKESPQAQTETNEGLKPKSEKTPQPKREQKANPPEIFENSLGMKFVPVPGTKVQFCIWETRVKDYAAYAAASNVGVNASWKDFGIGEFRQTGMHPVVNVSWNEAQAFCAWLTKKELAAGKIKAGQKYRLPTDAEWSVAVGLGKEKGNTPKEKAFGIKSVYPWGKEWPPPKGAGNYAEQLKVDEFEFTSPVGSFAANTYGLFDFGGNVWEWCEDWLDPEAKEYRVVRGASIDRALSEALLSCIRNRYPAIARGNDIGFRCVLEDGSTK